MNFIFKKDHIPEECYWSAFGKFLPLNDAIEYLIYNGESGAEKAQIECLKEIEANYLNVENEIFEFIHQSLKKLSLNKKESYSKRKLTLESISILKSFPKDSCWEMDFSLNQGFGCFTIEMKEWIPYHFSISA
jgi:hypothetical protein